MFNKNNNKGFSLIELSIVLIIMGLLVAGVTGGASLIKSAKIRSVCDDYLNYKNAYNSYYAQFGERPGEDDNGNLLPGGIFPALITAGVIDGNLDEGGENDSSIKKVTKLKDKDAKFKFDKDVGVLGENKYIFEQNSVLLSLAPVTAEEGKSILQKIDTKEGDSGSVRAEYNGSISANLNEEKTEPLYDLHMKMDF